MNHQAIKAIAIQSVSLMVTVVIIILLPWNINWFQAAGLQACIAAIISFYMPATPYWWRLIHLAFMPTLLAGAMIISGV
ncbi:MAG: hypothetical protein RQ714_05970 [Nitrosomonas sp.]|nr:hypothetical protein [Nitrosomonas sp.]